jgi:hypothetical protein
MRNLSEDGMGIAHSYTYLKIYLCIFLVILTGLIFTGSVIARVSGYCSNCHTMHNSQNGAPMSNNYDGTTTPNQMLLRGDCLGCHAQRPGDTSNIINNVPQVLHKGTDLAGGNYAYITGGKSRGTGTDSSTAGHNVVDLGVLDGSLSSPPGDQHGTGITNNNLTCAGQYGCHGDRTITDKTKAMRGAHHTDDSVLKFGTINVAGQGGTTGLSYRFLNGVKGGEDADWEATVSSTSHNEYFGDTTMSSSSATSPAGNTISGLCAECHGYFHGTTSSEANDQSPWRRHPTDTTLPGTGSEYASYTTYSLTAPVARTSAWTGWTGGGSPSGAVSPDGNADDIVMCLSCHRAHASPSFKMTRWDIKNASLSTALSGCNVCHTSKN